MRRQLALMVAATTSLVLLAFLLPLALLVRDVAASRAIRDAQSDAQALVPIVATVTDANLLRLAVQRTNQDSPRRVSVFPPSGSVVGAPADEDPNVALARGGRSFSARVRGGQALLVPVVGRGGTAVVRVFVPSRELTRGVARAVLVLTGLGIGLLLVALLVADRLVRGVVRPIEDLAGAAHRLGSGELDARVVPAGPPETVAVGEAMNQLAERIRELLAAEREAAADLSHRLRTPLTALRLNAEGLRDREEAARIGADVDALERTVNQVIREARRVRSDAPARSDVVEVVRSRVAFWTPLAEDQGREVRLDLPFEPRVVSLREEDLTAAVDALLVNVFAHTPEGAGLTVVVSAGPDGTTRLSVADAGPGLPDAGRLQRGVSGTKSTGLGLDIARRTAEATGGSLQLRSEPGRGTAVTLELRAAGP